MSVVPHPSAQPERPRSERLDSWKEVAAYLNRSVRTVKRWEKLEGLPVRRHQHEQLSSVWAFTSELDAWAHTRQPRRQVTASPQAEPAVSGESANDHHRPRWISPLVAVATAAIILGGVAYFAFRDATSSSVAQSPALLAVLPMVNLSGDARDEYLSDGLTEDMIAHLGAADPTMLAVVARTSSMYYKHTRKRVDEIARELGVDYLLEGSVRRDDSRIRVTAQLIDARTQRNVWAEQYDRDARDIPSVQSDVVRAIGRAVSMRLTNKRRALAVPPGHRPKDAEVFHLYLRGLYEYNKRTGEGFRHAIDHFSAAIERDPSYARGYVGLANTYALMGGYGMMPIRESHPRARTAASKALEIDDTLAEAHAALGTIASDYDWDWPEAERRFRVAIELNPSLATAYQQYSFYLSNMGRFDEALAAAGRAQELDPLSLAASANVGLVHFRARRNDEAITHLRHTLEMDPMFGYTHLCLGLVYAQSGKVDQAIREFQAAKTLSGLPNADALIGYARARSGMTGEAKAILASLQGRATTQPVAAYHVALVYTALNDRDRAFLWLNRAIDAREWFVGMLKTDTLLDPLRADARFGDVLQRVGHTP
jgi:TolB-like protein/tetratricopeptide (TPR) repeat protein